MNSVNTIEQLVVVLQERHEEVEKTRQNLMKRINESYSASLWIADSFTRLAELETKRDFYKGLLEALTSGVFCCTEEKKIHALRLYLNLYSLKVDHFYVKTVTNPIANVRDGVEFNTLKILLTDDAIESSFTTVLERIEKEFKSRLDKQT